MKASGGRRRKEEGEGGGRRRRKEEDEGDGRRGKEEERHESSFSCTPHWRIMDGRWKMEVW